MNNFNIILNLSEQEDSQYRFGGYQLPKIILDETGPAYVVLNPHPYYRNQPLYWQKPAYVNGQEVNYNYMVRDYDDVYPSSVGESIERGNTEKEIKKRYQMLKF